VNFRPILFIFDCIYARISCLNTVYVNYDETVVKILYLCIICIYNLEIKIYNSLLVSITPNLAYLLAQYILGHVISSLKIKILLRLLWQQTILII
jgi:hypothetical protein